MTDTQQQQQPEEVVEQEVVQDEKLSEWEEKAKNWESKYLRILADYQNLEKRMRDERIAVITSANRDLLLRFLPVLDTVYLAQQHDQNPTLGIVVNQFLDTLKSEQVTKIKTVDEKFDPQTMEVVTTTEGKEGVVIQEVRPGYLLHDKLLRAAQVIVGKGTKGK